MHTTSTCFLLALTSAAVLASLPPITHVQFEYSAVVDGNIDVVWDVVKNFNNLTWAFNQTVVMKTGVNNQVGATRTVFYGDVEFTDQLRSLSYDDYTWTFEMVNFTNGFYPGPVVNAITSISLSPIYSTNSTLVWLEKAMDTDVDSYPEMAASLPKVVIGLVNCVVQILTTEYL